MAKLFGTLRKTEQLDRTLIVFHSDNGYAIGPHNMNGKRFHYDESLRVPLYMRGPGLPQGVTVVHRGHRPGPHGDDPRRRRGRAAAAARRRRRPALDRRSGAGAGGADRGVVGGGAEQTARLVYAGVRVGAWTYVEYRRGGAELYDRSRDPFEMYNLADDPSYADVRSALSSLTERYRACAGDTARESSTPPIGSVVEV